MPVFGDLRQETRHKRRWLNAASKDIGREKDPARRQELIGAVGAVKQALKGVATEPGVANADPAKIKDMFFRRLYISYSDNVKPENVKLTRIDGGGWKMDVNYELRKPMIANLDVVGKFTATQNLSNSAAID